MLRNAQNFIIKRVLKFLEGNGDNRKLPKTSALFYKLVLFSDFLS
jgi:hypothetical protein